MMIHVDSIAFALIRRLPYQLVVEVMAEIMTPPHIQSPDERRAAATQPAGSFASDVPIPFGVVPVDTLAPTTLTVDRDAREEGPTLAAGPQAIPPPARSADSVESNWPEWYERKYSPPSYGH